MSDHEGAKSSIWVTLLDGVFSVTNSVFGFLSLQQQNEISENVAEASAYDYARNTVFGIPKEVVVAMVAVVGILAFVAIVKPKK